MTRLSCISGCLGKILLLAKGEGLICVFDF